MIKQGPANMHLSRDGAMRVKKLCLVIRAYLQGAYNKLCPGNIWVVALSSNVFKTLA